MALSKSHTHVKSTRSCTMADRFYLRCFTFCGRFPALFIKQLLSVRILGEMTRFLSASLKSVKEELFHWLHPMVLATFTTSLYDIYPSLSITTIIFSTYVLLSNYCFKAIQQITDIAYMDTVKRELGTDQEQQEQHCLSPFAKEDF